MLIQKQIPDDMLAKNYNLFCVLLITDLIGLLVPDIANPFLVIWLNLS